MEAFGDLGLGFCDFGRLLVYAEFGWISRCFQSLQNAGRGRREHSQRAFSTKRKSADPSLAGVSEFARYEATTNSTAAELLLASTWALPLLLVIILTILSYHLGFLCILGLSDSQTLC